MTAIGRFVYGTCAQTRDCLSAQLEDELRGVRRFRVRGHLARCERCRAVLASLARTVDQLRALGRAETKPPDSVAEAVITRLTEHR